MNSEGYGQSGEYEDLSFDGGLIMTSARSCSFRLVRLLAALALASAFVSVAAQTTSTDAASQASIVRKVEQALQKKPALRDLRVSVDYKDGALVLDGTVPSQKVIDDIVLTAAKASGVKLIVNNLWHE